ncbi:MAG: LysR family transcriptional regulator [Propylenella sp.]
MDRLESMAVLVAAAEAGSLSAAARRLGMPLATASRKVSDLERHLKTRLFVRSSRRLTLTDSGRTYLAACRRILEQVEEAERSAAGEYRTPRGELTLTAPIVFGRLHVLPIILQFLRDYPDIRVRLVQTDRIVDLIEEHADLALRIGELPDSSLVATRVSAVRRVVCGSPAYFAARGAPQRPEEIATHDCISFEGLTSPDEWTFRIGKADRVFPIRSRLVVNTAEAAIDAAIAGLGVVHVLSYQIADAVRAGRLALVLEDFEPSPWSVSLVYSGQPQLPVKLRAFLDFAAPRLRSRLERLKRHPGPKASGNQSTKAKRSTSKSP